MKDGRIENVPRSLALAGLLAASASCNDTDPVGAGATDGETTGSTTQATSAATTQETSDSGPTPDMGADEPPPGVIACAEGYAIPYTEQAPGDPDAGYTALIESGYVTCGIPYSLFSLAKPFLGSFATGEPLPGRTGKNAEVPYNWTVHSEGPSGAEIVSLNCLECHGGHFNGELVVGLGKADADYTENLGQSLGGVPIPDLGIAGYQELSEFVGRYQVIGDDVQMYTVGTNPADRLAAVLASHRDVDTLAWSDEAHTQVPDVVLPVDTPPWWRVSKKHGMFYNGMGRVDHRSTMMFASSLCTDSVQEAEQIFEIFDDIRAYLTTIEAPTYPFAIDAELADEGRAVFETNCACCHGTYAESEADETYPNLLIPVDVVGTDPTVAAEVAKQPFAEWFNASWYGQIGPLSPEDPFVGYVAPPLDGIWATAPYLHNASVPTLELVLDSTRRPTYWRRVDYDSTNFDADALGWPWVELPYGQDDAPADERKHVYDTTKIGHWNTGHTFGDHLSDSERRAVLEYLKTL